MGRVKIGDGDRLLTVNETAALLGLSPATIYGYAHQRRLPKVKLSGPRGPVRFRVSDVERLVANNTTPAIRYVA
jgi:excisionase family DNA binding protein